MALHTSSKSLAAKIRSKEALIAVIGMGYVGLSLLEVFGTEGFPIIGLECDAQKVEQFKQGANPMGFLPLEHLFPLYKEGKFTPTCDPAILSSADIIVISVPTTLDKHQQPDFVPLRTVFQEVADYAQMGQLIILQSTTYPGTTEEELLPKVSERFKVGEELFVGYVPEISDIGNPNHTFQSVPRILGGVSDKCTKMIKLLYETIGCTTYVCKNTRIAEAAKIYQNTYRLINISFVNEMKVLFDRLDMDVWDVINAAATKPFGFTRFDPSPGIGGDCIPADPFYLTWKAKAYEAPTQMIDIAGHVNDAAPYYVVEKITNALASHGKSMNGAKLLLLGVAFKKNVDDPRHSSSIKVLDLLKMHGGDVSYNDPFIPHLRVQNMDSIALEKLENYDAVVILTDHSEYDWKLIEQKSRLIIDTRHVVHGNKVVRA